MINSTITFNGAFPFDDAFTFDEFSTRKLKYSSNSSVKILDRLIDIEQENIITRKFLKLEIIIGKELFNSLSYQDKIFMIETANAIDFGHTVDLEKISQEIKNYDVLQK
jgi:hypothetical protein